MLYRRLSSMAKHNYNVIEFVYQYRLWIIGYGLGSEVACFKFIR